MPFSTRGGDDDEETLPLQPRAARPASGPWYRRATPLCWALSGLVVVFVVLFLWRLIADLVALVHVDEIAASGHAPATRPLHAYGFGEEKWLLVIDLHHIGSVDAIPISDKQRAHMAIWRKGVPLVTQYDVGLELKGHMRHQSNYGFQLWAADLDGDDFGGYDDVSRTLPMFNNEAEE
jgi:hypothetical protein